VRGRYQIVFSNRESAVSASEPRGFWSRFKALLIGLAFLVVAGAILMAALIFGSILAAVLWVCLVLVIAFVILKATWRGLKPGQR